MKRIFAIAAMFALPASVGFAAIDTDGLISRFQGDGYTTIEVTRGINETKVEAIRNNEKVEVVYDNATGSVLETEFGTPDADDDIRPGVTVRDRNRDFVRDDDDRDDDQDDGADGAAGRARSRALAKGCKAHDGLLRVAAGCGAAGC